MIAIILNFLKSHWLGSVVVLFVLAITAKLSIDRIEIKHLHNQLSVCSSENITLETANKSLVGSIENQNAAISVLRAETEKKMKASARALVAARASARKYTIAAQQIKVSKNTGDDCVDMRSLVNNYIKTVRQ